MARLRQLLALLAVLAGCATTPARDARLVLEGGSVAFRSNGLRGFRAAINEMRRDYHKAMGDSYLFDYWMGLYEELVDTAEAGEAAETSNNSPNAACAC